MVKSLFIILLLMFSNSVFAGDLNTAKWKEKLLLRIYHCNENGGNAYDTVGGNVGTITGAIWSFTQRGVCLYYDGTASVSLGDIALSTHNLTLAGWYKRNSATGTITLISKLVSSRSYYVFSEAVQIQFEISHDGTEAEREVINGAITADTNWHFFTCVTRFPNTLISDFNIYQDGKNLVLTRVAQDGAKAGINNSADADRIGVNASTQYFLGYIDEVMIFDKALTSGEVRELYNSQVGRFKQIIQ